MDELLARLSLTEGLNQALYDMPENVIIDMRYSWLHHTIAGWECESLFEDN